MESLSRHPENNTFKFEDRLLGISYDFNTWTDNLGTHIGSWKVEPKLSYIPEKVIFNGTTTICHWNDGTKTVVKCADDEKFIPEVGIAEATMKKIYGTRMAFLRIVKNAYVQPEKKIKAKKESQDAL